MKIPYNNSVQKDHSHRPVLSVGAAIVTLLQNISAFNILTHRVSTVCSTHQLLEEEEHFKQALQKCKDLNWALNRAKNQ